MSSNDNADLQGSAGEKQLGGVGKIPFYLVCDESGSMAGAPIDAVNQGLAQIFREIAADPIVDDKAMIGVIAFQANAEVLVPLSSTSEVASIPSCNAGGTTSYKSAFIKLKEQIQVDVERIRSLGHSVGRPVVFFMSDGAPNRENWQEAHAALVERDDSKNPYRPHIISFGVGEAKGEVIKAVASDVDRAKGTRFAYIAAEGVSPGPALAEIMHFITGTIVGSARKSEVVIPQIPESSGVMLIDPLPIPNV